MQVSVETKEGLERTMSITVGQDALEQKVTAELKKLAQNRSVPGFRKGKIPPAAARKMFGKQARLEAVYNQMYESFVAASQQEKLQVAGMPSFEPTVNEEGQDLQFQATFEVYPEIDLQDFSTINIEKPSAEITTKDLERMVESLRKQQATWTDTKRKAQKGDKLTIDFKGFIGDEAFAGGEAQDFELELGSNSMIPGFESSLEGHKVGEEFDINVTFPEDYQKEDLQGKEAVFSIVIKGSQKPELPELNETLFTHYGIKAQDGDEFKAKVKSNMQQELERSSRTLLKGNVIKSLLEAHEFNAPKALINEEIERLKDQAIERFGNQQPIDKSMLPNELFQAQAEQRVRSGLLLSSIVEQQDIKPSEAKIKALIDDIASTYEDPKQVHDFYNSPQQRPNLEALSVEEQIIDSVLEKAKVKTVKESYENIISTARQNEQ